MENCWPYSCGQAQRGVPSVDMADEILNLSRNKEGLLGLYQLSLTQLQSVKGGWER